MCAHDMVRLIGRAVVTVGIIYFCCVKCVLCRAVPYRAMLCLCHLPVIVVVLRAMD